ncbi:uncharacterized protein BP5553_08058 [Venustampulla echinocandica]|uniref:Uncharacterized protein n=1 Tax=Venustampulla echinocandica TaxID=2656787 RepID=A0A370TFM0_9HELO|nr:uncharacterized protein BP5553_08058 [Venustampulla echinocandica]RDL33690.1 hypothetical protein BP5553_08058 [Venustampulla echinocandica]
MGYQSHKQSNSQTMSAKEQDGASMMSTSTYASTMSILKEAAKQKLHLSSKDSDKKARKEAKKSAARSTVLVDGVPTKKRQPLKDSMTPRQRTAEAYMIQATLK